MNIDKQGVIYCPHEEHEWEKDTFMTPHALSAEKWRIRIFEGDETLLE